MFSVGELSRMDEDGSLLFRCKAGRFGWLAAGFFRVFKPHLLRQGLQGFELVHAFIIEQIF